MGFRFRKSVTIFPGVKINFSKSGASLSIGRKGAHFNVNTSGRTSASVGIPGTGVSYSKTFTSGRKKKKAAAKTSSARGKKKPDSAASAEAAEKEESGSVMDNLKDEVNEQFERHTKELPWIFVGMAALIVVLLIAVIVMLAMNIISRKNAASTAAAPAAVTAEASDAGGGAAAAQADPESGGSAAKQKFVVNTSTKKFHKPSCKYAKSATNVKTMTTTRESLIEEGYAACGTCKP